MADGAALSRLQARCPQGTSIIVRIVNIPDFFSRVRLYERSKVFVAIDNDQIVGSAACALRDGIVDGEVARVGYLFQLFVAPEARRSGLAGLLCRRREEYLEEHGAVLAYTLIMEGNKPSIRYIEGQGYEQRRRLRVSGLYVHEKTDVDTEANIRSASLADLDEIAELLNTTWAGHELRRPASADSLAAVIGRIPGYEFDNLLLAERDGTITACVGYWQWDKFMEITVESLSARMKLDALRMKAERLFHPMPDSLKPGQRVRQMMLTPVGFTDTSDLGALVRTISNVGVDVHADVMYAISESDSPLVDALSDYIHADSDVHLYVKPFSRDIRADRPIIVPGTDL